LPPIKPVSHQPNTLHAQRQFAMIQQPMTNYFCCDKSNQQGAVLMKILHVYKTYFPDTIGGAEFVIHQIAQGVAKHGVQTKILVMSQNNDTINHDGLTVHRCKKQLDIAATPFSISAFAKMKRLAAWADIIHYTHPYPFADMLHFACRIKKPSLVTYQSDIIKQRHWLKLYKPLQHQFLSQVDCIATTSPNYFQGSTTLARYAHKVKTITLGLDANLYPQANAETKTYWKKRLPEKYFLFVGVLRYYKGLTYLLEAAKQAPFPIVIAGTGPEETALKLQAQKLGLDNLYFLGTISNEDKHALLEQCYAFVFPSHVRTEAFGLSLVEASIYGKAMISCEIGTGTSYINLNQETGLTIPPEDVTALARALNDLWQNPKKTAAMGKKAKKRYQNKFTAEQMVQGYLQAYQQLYKVTSVTEP
jgi:O-antigen biosynthesis rhamnosyltransferase